MQNFFENKKFREGEHQIKYSFFVPGNFSYLEANIMTYQA